MNRHYLLLMMVAIGLLTACSLSAGANQVATPQVIVTKSIPTATHAVVNATSIPTKIPTVISQPPTAVSTAVLPPVCNLRTDWLLYSVVAGDTLGSIASRVGSTSTELASANCLTNPNAISVGQQLRVPQLPQTIPTPYDQTPRILLFVLKSSYPATLEWRTENVGQVLLYVSDSSGDSRFIGTFDPNSSTPAPTTTGVATFRLTMLDMNGKAVIGANGLPVYAIAQTSGGGSSGGELECPVPNSGGSGTIDVAPMEASWSSCIFVKRNQTVTLVWADMPTAIQNIEYYFIPMAGTCSGAVLNNPNVVTSDPNTSDGSSASWLVGYENCAGVLYAFGYTSNSMIESKQRPLVIR